MKKKVGVLLHITSLPSKQNIGTFGRKAYEFVDFISECGINCWQILPLNITDKGNSPYQSPSAFAGNTNLIDFDELCESGYIKRCDYAFVKNNSKKSVNYALAEEQSKIVLKLAFKNFRLQEDSRYKEFEKQNAFWLDDFAIFMTASEINDCELRYWQNYRIKSDEVIKQITEQFPEKISYYKFTQFLFFEQWFKLKNYANECGIEIIGDLPFYVSGDSADLWSNADMFKVDDNLIPLRVAGVPPDSFSEKGQLWGNPVYDFEKLENDGFNWLIKRFKHALNMYDVVRVDHFRAFEGYYEVPFGEEDAKNGKWVKSCGMKFFNLLKQKTQNYNIIAEDLGFITDDVRRLVSETGFPNMKVAQFGFDGNPFNEHLPCNYNGNCVAYLGTHDNNTSRGFLENSPDYILNNVKSATGRISGANVVEKLIRLLISSNCKAAIITMQDFLNLDESSRMNIPSTIENNWCFRLSPYYKTDKLKRIIAEDLKFNI